MLVTSSLAAFVFKGEISGEKKASSEKKFNLKACFLMVDLQGLWLVWAFFCR